MQDEGFEWDDEKAQSNVTKHRVAFSLACKVFADLGAIDTFDDRADYGEERRNRTGFADGRLLTVCYTRRDVRFRIISARRASKREQDTYFIANS